MSTETNEITLAAFIAQHGLTMEVKRTNRNTNMDDDKYPMDHWICNIHNRAINRMMTVTFSQGSGHKGKAPQIADVLNCLANDAHSVADSQSFEDWCCELGYDEDSRKAFRVYEACEEQTANLKALLDNEAFDQLLYHTEQL